MNHKQREWNKIEEWAKLVVDGVGCSIDGGIFQTVVALNALGFMTTMSCEGHVDSRGLSVPWVDISGLMPEEEEAIRISIKSKWGEINQASEKHNTEKVKKLSEEYHKLIYELKKPTLELASRLANLLEEFYETRNVSFFARLILDEGPSMRLISQGALFQELYNKLEKQRRLKEFQKEMNDFTEFLKKKYFEEN